MLAHWSDAYIQVSMIDVRTWSTIVELLSVIDHNRRPDVDDKNTDALGNLHVILFGDFKPLGRNLTFALSDTYHC